jgi:hypothetical protein
MRYITPLASTVANAAKLLEAETFLTSRPKSFTQPSNSGFPFCPFFPSHSSAKFPVSAYS